MHEHENVSAEEDGRNRAFLGFMGGFAVEQMLYNNGVTEAAAGGIGIAAGVAIYAGAKIVREWLDNRGDS